MYYKAQHLSFVAVILAILFALTFFTGLPVTNAVITTPTVEVTPNVINVKADYQITFVVNNYLPLGGTITVRFPQGTIIPCSSCNPWISAANLRVNNVTCSRNGKGDTVARTVEIFTPVALNAGDEVKVFISKNARIVNPMDSGNYTLQVSTSSEPTFVTSSPYQIGRSQLSKPEVTLDSYLNGKNASYTITFDSGPIYTLLKDIDTLTVVFPEGTYVPSFIKGENILVNGKPCAENGFGEDRTMVFKVPDTIPPKSNVTVQFTLQAGIKNPDKTGAYSLLIKSNKDPVEVKSFPYNILDITDINTSIIITPTAPDGLNGWYKTNPVVVLFSSTNVEGTTVTYYKLDNGEFTQYTTPLTIPNGIHTLYFYSENAKYGLTEPVKSKEYKIDTVAPTLNIVQPEGNITVASKKYTIKGSVGEPSNNKLLINGNEVSLNEDGSFSLMVNLKEGENPFEFKCVDEAGNETKDTRIITVSTVIPKIIITTPYDWEEIQEDSLTINGSVDTESTLTVNGNPVPLNEDKTFIYTFSLEGYEKGSVPIKIVATAKKSGLSATKTIVIIYNPKPKETTIKLVIGLDEALINGKATMLDSPPFIDPHTDRTLVPLRFISEAFGADVQWDELTRSVTVKLNDKEIKLQIGNNQASVNGEIVSLDQPPVIENNRTMVPIRFISESLGAKVDWDGETKTITIIYTL